VAAAAHVLYLSFLCDDAFIAYRYAENLANGKGMVFNAGERVEGFTSPLWVLLCAAGIRMGLPPERWTAGLGAAVAIATLGMMLERRRRRSRSFLPGGLMIAGNAGWAAWATGGLETSLFTAFVSLALLTLVESGEAERFPVRLRTASGALLGLSCLTRPEGALIAGLSGVFLGREVLRGRLAARRWLGWAALWVVPLAVLVVWRLLYFGRPVPNTFLAKTPGLGMLPIGLGYVAFSVLRLHLYLPTGVVLFALLRRSGDGTRSPFLRLAATVTLPYLAYVAAVGGDFMDLYRFVVPILPFGLLAAGEALSEHTGAVRETGRSRWVRPAVVLGLAAYVGLNGATSYDSTREWTRRGLDSVGLLRRYVEDWSRVGRRLRALAAPTDTLATSAAGCVPYFSKLTTIDQLGLMAPELTRYEPAPYRRPGHSLLLESGELLARRPHYILGSPQVRARGERRRMALYVADGDRSKLQRHYRLLDLSLPGRGGRRCVIAVRKDVAEREVFRSVDSAGGGGL
jgi:hypothetical protein